MRRLHLSTLGAFAVVLSSGLAHADTIRVRAGASIQAAVDAASSGDTIVCAPGTFHENVVVSGRTDLTIVARGATIQAADQSNAALTVQSCSNVRVSGVHVEGGAGGCVRLQDCRRVAISRARIHATTGAGVSATTCENVSVVQCAVAGGSAGASLNTCSGVRVSRCRVQACDGAAVDVATCSGVRIDHDVCTGGNSAAIHVTADVSAGVQAATIVGNRCTSNSQGISVTTATSVDVRSNVVAGCAGDGIALAATGDASGCAVIGNRVLECGGGGVTVGGGSNCQVTRNIVSAAVGVGIRISGSAAVVAKNRVSGCGGDALVVETQGATIQGNAVAHAGGDGIVISGNDNTVQQNQVSAAVDAAVQIDASASGNVVAGNTSAGSGSTLDDQSAVGANTLIDGGIRVILGGL